MIKEPDENYRCEFYFEIQIKYINKDYKPKCNKNKIEFNVNYKYF
jgi:hypothetical protein